jgi:hypothetical protein
MNLIKPLLKLNYITWCGMGFMRGINSYKYKHNKNEKKEEYLYVNLIGSGLIGTLLYANPFLLPVFIHKEFYRFEVNVRNLENEKNTDYYNDLF